MNIGSNEWSNLIIEGARCFELDLDRRHTDQFAAHAQELLIWTRKFSLTAITEPRKIAIKHFLDSLAAARFIPPGAGLLDIGSGGGFPGIPLKVVMPSLALTLIDASRKKVNFIKHIIRKLQLDVSQTIHGRAEDLAADPVFSNRFDVIISRALSALDAFVALALPLLAREGVIIALKGEVDHKEVDDLRHKIFQKPGADNSIDQPLCVSIEKYNLPFLDASRSIVSIRRHG